MSETKRLAGTPPAQETGSAGGADGGPDWAELPLDPPPPRSVRPVRPAWITVVAAVLLLNGLSLVLYAGAISATPVLAPDPFAIVGVLTGLGALAAAFGVFLQMAWGRWLGIALIVGWLARDAVLFESWIRTGYRGMESDSPNLLLDIVLPIAVNLIVTGLLVRRWPARD